MRASRLSSISCAVVLIASCAAREAIRTPAAAPASSALAGELEIRDLMPEYWRWWAGVQSQGAEQQAESFWATFVKIHPDLYTSTVMGPSFAEEVGARVSVRRYFEAMPEFVQQMRSMSERMPELLRGGYANFREHCPDMQWKGPVYVIPALLSFDGATRPLAGKNHLFFAPDGIARWHKADDLCAFFAHELFHIYHDQYLPEASGSSRDPLWRSLWSEGLATYVSGQLCPGTKEDALLMSGTLATETLAVLPQLVSELRAERSSTDEKIYWRFFGGRTTDIPRRSGYVGYLVARRAAKAYTPEQLPRLDASTVRGLVESGLDGLLAAGAR